MAYPVGDVVVMEDTFDWFNLKKIINFNIGV
jgi:hypothetical protein